MTNRQLYSLFDQRAQLIAKNDYLLFLLKSKDREFYSNNLIRYQTLNKAVFDLTFKYYVHEDDPHSQFGKIMLFESDRPVLREGMTDSDFDAEMKQLMDIEVQIK